MRSIRFAGEQLVELYRRGVALFVLAPLILAVVVVPEFLQHIVEIHIGMFDSREAAHALGSDPTRWAFGYAKLAGLCLAMLGAARFWLAHARGRVWWRLGDVAWVRLVLAIALFTLVPLAPDLVRGAVPTWAHQGAAIVLSIVTLPLVFAAMGAMAGDEATLFGGYWRDWRWLPLLVLLLVAAYLPAMGLHLGFHRLALGAPILLLWPLMAADALVVGLLASLVGAAFAIGYEAARGEAKLALRRA